MKEFCVYYDGFHVWMAPMDKIMFMTPTGGFKGYQGKMGVTAMGHINPGEFAEESNYFLVNPKKDFEVFPSAAEAFVVYKEWLAKYANM